MIVLPNILTFLKSGVLFLTHIQDNNQSQNKIVCTYTQLKKKIKQNTGKYSESNG